MKIVHRVSVAAALFLFLVVGVDVVTSSCSIALKKLSERPPLLLLPGGPLNVSGFATPDADGILRLPLNASLVLACPGSGNQLLVANHSTGLRQTNATCVSGSELLVRGVGVAEAPALECAAHAERTAERDGSTRCGAGARGLRMRIGFRLLYGFLELVSTCFDDVLLTPIYSNYTLVHSIAGKRPGGERAIFRTAGVFGSVSPRRQYEQQNDTLRALLGSSQNFTRNDTITRGHFASRAGFVFWPQKRATFFYVNAAPQWKSVNAGVWAAVERAVRSLAAARGDLQVVTGAYGVTTLPDAQRQPTQLFLFANAGQRKMPVPALFWKVVYDPRTLEGVVVVSNNNPFESLSEHPELRLCADICARLRWLPGAVVQGNDIYCCEVDSLRQTVVDMPHLDVLGVLDTSFPSRKAKKRAMTRDKKEKPETRQNENESGPPSGWLALLAAEAAFAREHTSTSPQPGEQHP